MAESWFSLSRDDQVEALEFAAARTGRPAHLLEKDIWVVWVLSAIYESDLASKLTFKGGTSLSKVYRIIDRFSEDVDLTYDIRELAADLLKQGNPIPDSASQEKKISSAVRHRLPGWIEATVKPVIAAALAKAGLDASLTLAGKDNDKLILAYPAVKTGTGYSAPTIQLEFGARATGEPHHVQSVACDIAPEIEGVTFPVAQPLVMAAERTFWEKATAAHVYCLQGRLRGERYSRHWYDLAAIAKHRTLLPPAPTARWLKPSQNTNRCSSSRKMRPATRSITSPLPAVSCNSSRQANRWRRSKRTMPPCWKMVCWR